MDYKIVWSSEAIFDLKEVCTYIAKDNPSAATRIGEGIMKQTESSAHFQKSARFIDLMNLKISAS